MKTWVHAPIWLNSKGISFKVCRIGFYLVDKSYFNRDTTEYKSIPYNLKLWASELGVSKTTIISAIKDMESLGYAVRTGNEIKIMHSPYCETSFHNMEPFQNVKPSVSKYETPIPKYETPIPECEISTPVYDRLEQGFPTLLVLLKYYHSKTTVVSVVDFEKLIWNFHKMEVFIMARRENFTDPGDKMLGFQNNNKFQGCIKWVLEAYAEDDNSGDDLPMDRYLLYLLLDCIRNGKKPEGRFISAITKLQNDGERFPIDLTEAKLIDEKDAAKVEMTRRVQSTLRMVDGLDKPIEATRVGYINLLEMFKNKKSEVN